MNLEFDPAADAIYVSFRSADAAVARTWEVDDCRSVDYDAGDLPIGVELLSVSAGVDLTGLPRAGEIAGLLAAFRRVPVAS